MNDDEIHNAIVDIVSEVKLVTGAVVYQGKELQLQIQMLKRFIATGFGMLSKAEVVEAFYMNNQGQFDDVYVHYNKELNAEFVGAVLRAYMRYKVRFLNEKRDKIIDLLAPIKAQPKKIDYQFWKDEIQDDLQKIKQGKIIEQKLWSNRKYYTLRQVKLVPYKNIKSFFYFIRIAITTFRWPLNLPDTTDLSKYQFVTMNQIWLLFKNKDDFKKCISEARKFSYWMVINGCAQCGINNIWEDVKP